MECITFRLPSSPFPLPPLQKNPSAALLRCRGVWVSHQQVGLTPVPPATLARELRGDAFERGVRVRADRPNGGQADDHDQRQHHGVLNRGGAIFRDEEMLHLHSETLHSILRFSGGLVDQPYKLSGAVKKLIAPGSGPPTATRRGERACATPSRGLKHGQLSLALSTSRWHGKLPHFRRPRGRQPTSFRQPGHSPWRALSFASQPCDWFAFSRMMTQQALRLRKLLFPWRV